MKRCVAVSNVKEKVLGEECVSVLKKVVMIIIDGGPRNFN